MNVLLISSDRTSTTGVPINLGDALLTDMLASSVRSRGLQVDVADFGSVRTCGGEPRLNLTGIATLYKAMRTANFILVGGGTLFQDDTPGRRFSGLSRLMFAVSALAWIARRPVYFFGVGCDPIKAWDARILLRLAVFRRAIWVRDEESQRRCWTLLGTRALLAADVSLLGAKDPSFITAEPRQTPKNRLSIALNREHGDLLTGRLLNSLRTQFDDIVFVQMDQGNEGDALRLNSEVRGRFDEITEGLTWKDAVKILADSSVVLASRMHAMYITAMASVPTAAIGGAAKVDAFIHEFGITRLSTLDGWDGTATRANIDAVQRARWRVETQLDALIRLAWHATSMAPRPNEVLK
jgi:polysaccharide pyruvyl transferase WcaK-like protein